MLELIFFAIFLGSFAGLVYMIGKKVPLVLAFPVTESNSLDTLGGKMKEYATQLGIMKWISSPELFLQRLLSVLRILFLRMEQKTNEWLMKLRKKSQEKNGTAKFSPTYWEDLKKK